MKACCEIAAMFQRTCLDCNKPRRAPHVKNPCAKTVDREHAYEVWSAGDWTWYVLKKWQADDDQPYARWFCDVITPHAPRGEMGDVYVADIKRSARRVK